MESFKSVKKINHSELFSSTLRTKQGNLKLPIPGRNVDGDIVRSIPNAKKFKLDFGKSRIFSALPKLLRVYVFSESSVTLQRLWSTISLYKDILTKRNDQF